MALLMGMEGKRNTSPIMEMIGWESGLNVL